MCNSLMDSDIQEILTMILDPNELDSDFYNNFPQVAAQIWDPVTFDVPNFGTSLGYPNLAHQQHQEVGINN